MKIFYTAIFPALQTTGLGPLFGALTSRLYIYKEFCGFQVRFLCCFTPSCHSCRFFDQTCNETLGGTDRRHPEILRWIKSRRPATFTPRFLLDDFEQCWWDWWCTIQSGNHRIEGERPCFEEQNVIDWEELNIWGLNGIVLVVVALSWWGKALDKTDTPRKSTSWPDAVRDVTWALWELEVALSLKRDLGAVFDDEVDDDDDDDAEGDDEVERETITIPLSPLRKGKRRAHFNGLEKPHSKRARLFGSENENSEPSQSSVSPPRRTCSRRG